MQRSLFVYWLGIFCTLMILAGCSSDPEPSAFVEGQISDTEENASQIHVTIVHQDSAIGETDTLYHQTTDTAGYFSGSATVPSTQEYTLQVSRDDQSLAGTSLILADGDTVRLNAELPDFNGTLDVSSREQQAMEVFNRVDNGFERIARFAELGQITGDSLEIELNKWSDLYWQVYEDNQQTLAGQYAVAEAVRLLSMVDGSEMMAKIRRIQDEDELADIATIYGKDYLARNNGLDHTLAYLDTLQQNTELSESNMRIQMERIKILYDSARSEEAMERLAQFQEEFSDDQNAQRWAESVEYDLSYLAPGDTLPPFSFQDNGRVVSRDSMVGRPYILEITNLANSLYQEQYDRTVVIHSIYKNFELEIVTIPLDPSQITINAFFEERMKPWPVASADDFDREELMEEFNITQLPTRFLIDREGKIVRKFVGTEFDDVIASIKTLISQEEEEEPPS